MEKIHVQDAHDHNLAHVDLEIPRDALVVFTGVSGSGKSSLAFNTIYAEGQRRYVESLNAYARQFIGQFDKPKVGAIDGLSPAIAIDQKSTSNSPRSTVGTITEIHDFLRVLFARIGSPHCPQCQQEITPQSLQKIVDSVMAFAPGTRIQILAPIVRGRKGEYNVLFHQLRKEGIARVRVDGQLLRLDELPDDYRLAKTKLHTIEAILDRIIIKPADTVIHRLTEALKSALKKADGFVLVEEVERDENSEEPDAYTCVREHFFSEHLACPTCNVSYDEMAPRLFSFNSPYGACTGCEGLGFRLEIAPHLLIPDPSKSMDNGAIPALEKTTGRYYATFIQKLAKRLKFSPSTPFEELPDGVQHSLLFGPPPEEETPKKKPSKSTKASKKGAFSKNIGHDYDESEEEDVDWFDLVKAYDGIVPILNRRYQHGIDVTKRYIEGFMVERPCTACGGKRLKPISLSVTLGGQSLYDIGEFSIQDAYRHIRSLWNQLEERQLTIGRQALTEVEYRLQFLMDVGLGYLNLNRRASTLSGGEAQRIRLATQLGSALSGVLYVLDEPSIGLHPHNNRQLIETLLKLRDLGNTLIVVEHDEETIRAADWLVDIGPNAGTHGGHIMASGPPNLLLETKRKSLENAYGLPCKVPAISDSWTLSYLSGQSKISAPSKPREGNGKSLRIEGATAHNLKNLTVEFPLGTFIAVTGLSGSGKSTLIFDLLHEALRYHFGQKPTKPDGVKGIHGLEYIDKCIDIDQSPIGRTSRSNPATYTGLFDPIRKVFANGELARMRGYGPGRFSFNVKGGRCDSCNGDGTLSIEMNFLPDAVILCETCQGRRYNRETLEAKYQGKSIADVLDMTVEEAVVFFEKQPRIRHHIQVLEDVGLGYIRLGQPAPTFSGGEAQRIKLATELSKRQTGNTLYLMDEPTVGLHWRDMENLLKVLHRLVEEGNTIIVIEHNLDFISTADYIIDLGPEGGHRGGEIIDQGTPEAIAKRGISLTGQYLRPLFGLQQETY